MTFRQPRAVLISAVGTILLEQVEVHQSKTKKGDTFSAKTALGSTDVGFWSRAKGDDAKIQIMFDDTLMFDGAVDHVDVDWATTGIAFSGRDKGAALIDKTSSKKALNKKPHEIVKEIAAAHGIEAIVDEVPDRAGRIYHQDFDAISHRGSEWSWVNQLADQYGMNAYMTGGKLYFKDIDEELPALSVRYVPPTAASFAAGNWMTLKTGRNLILSRPVRTHVRSHDHKAKRAVHGHQEKAGSGAALTYEYVLPGLKQDQADRIAKKKHRENTRHEFDIRLDMPGDLTVNPRMKLDLAGTGTDWDRQYEIDGVEHRMGFGDGYRTTVSGKIGNKVGKG